MIKGNEYISFCTFINQYEQYLEMGDIANEKNYLIIAEVLYCFAAECLLKGILTENGIRVNKDHNLKQLFDALPVEYKNYFNKIKFDLNSLETHKLNFQKGRYFYDNPKEFTDKTLLSFDSGVKYVKSFSKELLEAYHQLMPLYKNFSYDCFDAEGNSHDNDYSFNGKVNEEITIILKTYQDANMINGFVKLSYDKNIINVKDSFNKNKLERILKVTPLQAGKIEIKVLLNKGKVKKICKNFDGNICTYKLNNENCSLKIISRD